MKFGWIVLLITAFAAGSFGAVLPHIGYIYPAGGSPGTNLQVSIGGQYLKDYSGIYISGLKVKAEKNDYFRIYERQEMNRIRRFRETLEARREEATDDLTKEQINRSLESLATEEAMVQELRQSDRKNPQMAKRRQFNPQIAERVDLTLSIPSDVEPGDYELRIITTNGLSNPLLFRISRDFEYNEREPNDDIPNAEFLDPPPLVVNGRIMPGDVDYFRFPARKGQKLVFQADARSLVPYLADAVPGWFQAVLTLYDEKGNEIAFDDDYRFNPDPVLIFDVPADGDYFIRINDSIYRGREDFIYRLSIGETPFIENIFPLGGPENSTVNVSISGVNLPTNTVTVETGGDAPVIQHIQTFWNGIASNRRAFCVDALPDLLETEPNNILSQAQAITNETIINGRIEQPGDVDCFRFEGRRGERKTIEIHARRLGSPLDARLVLLDSQEHILKVSDDFVDKTCGLITHHADARIDMDLPETGTYYLRLDDLQGKGGPAYAYRLAVAEELPDYQLRIVPSSVRLPRDGSAVLTVHAIRFGGFTGEIELSLKNAPSGLELDRAVIPEGAESAQVVITASGRVNDGIIKLQVEGKAKFGVRTVRRPAVPAEDMMQAFLYRHLVAVHDLLALVTDPDPVTVTVQRSLSEAISAKPGQEISLFARVNRQKGVRGRIQVTLSDPPEWLTLRTKYIEGQGERIIMDVSPNAEPGDKATIILNGTVRVSKSRKDPDYNPVNKFLNFREYNFSIDAIPVEITD